MVQDPLASKNYGREIAFILFSQKWVAILATLLVVAATFAVVFGVTPKYEAVGTFLVKGKKIDTDPGSLEKAQVRLMPITKADLYSEVEILLSGEVAHRTAQDLIPKGLWRFIGIPKESSEGYLTDMLQGRLASRLKTTVVPSSNVVEARLRWTDPKEAEIILEALMRNYLDYRNSIFNPQGVGEFFDEQVANYQKALDEKQKELMDIISTTNAPDAEAEIRQNLELSASIERQLNDLEAEYLNMKAFIGQIEAALSSKRRQYFSFIDNDTVRGLGTRLQDLVMKREQLRQLSAPRVTRRSTTAEDARLDDIEKARDQAMDQQIGGLHAQLRSEVRAVLEDRRSRLAGYEERKAALEARLTEIETRNVELKKAQMRADWLRQETALLTESFKTFFQRREQANLVESQDEGALNHVIILQRAEGNPTAVFPNERRLIPMGLLAALFTGISIAFLAHFFDQTVKRPEDVEGALGVPVLFSISDQGGRWERKVSRFRSKAAHERPSAEPARSGGVLKVALWGTLGAIFSLVVVLGLGLVAVRFADPGLWAEVEYVLFGTEPAKPAARSVPLRAPRPAERDKAVGAAPMPSRSPAPMMEAPVVELPLAEEPVTVTVEDSAPVRSDVPLSLPRPMPELDVSPPS